MFKKITENKNLLTLVLAVFVGILFIVFGLLGEDGEKTDTLEKVEYSSPELESYTASLEKRITAHLERIEGVSDVSVLLTVDTSGQNVFATEGNGNDYVIIKDSSGNENVVKLTEINAKVRGIAVVCNYQGNEEKRQQIISMLASLFNVGTNRISVMSA